MDKNQVALSYHQQAADIQEKESYLIALTGSISSISSVYGIIKNGRFCQPLYIEGAEPLRNP